MNVDASSPFQTGLLVGLGAGVGAVARTAVLALAIPGSSQEVMLIAAVNVLGCLLMGLLSPGAFLGTGALGGFTTFSAVTLAAVRSSAAFAVAYVLGMFVLCVGAWWVGDRLRGQHA